MHELNQDRLTQKIEALLGKQNMIIASQDAYIEQLLEKIKELESKEETEG